MASSDGPPTRMQTQQTAEEEASKMPPATPPLDIPVLTEFIHTQKNIAVVKEYMNIAYSPKDNKGASSVAHLCTKDSWFWAPTTFPDCKTPMDYAESHSHVMASISDLHIVCYDQAFAKDGHVLLRYTAEGSHVGEPHNGIKATGNKAKWSAAAIFEVKDGKVHSFTKDWDKLHMWKQLGWMKGEEYV